MMIPSGHSSHVRADTGARIRTVSLAAAVRLTLAAPRAFFSAADHFSRDFSLYPLQTPPPGIRVGVSKACHLCCRGGKRHHWLRSKRGSASGHAPLSKSTEQIFGA